MGGLVDLAPGTAPGAAQGSLGWGALATGLNVAGQIETGVGQQQESNYAAAGAREQATAALAAGSQAESVSKGRTTRLVASQEAAQAANGIQVTSGSAEAVRSATQNVGDLDTALIHFNAAREAFGLNAQAAMDVAAGKGALVKGLIGGATSFLGGASSLADKWATYQLSGAMGSRRRGLVVPGGGT